MCVCMCVHVRVCGPCVSVSLEEIWQQRAPRTLRRVLAVASWCRRVLTCASSCRRAAASAKQAPLSTRPAVERAPYLLRCTEAASRILAIGFSGRARLLRGEVIVHELFGADALDVLLRLELRLDVLVALQQPLQVQLPLLLLLLPPLCTSAAPARQQGSRAAGQAGNTSVRGRAGDGRLETVVWRQNRTRQVGRKHGKTQCVCLCLRVPSACSVRHGGEREHAERCVCVRARVRV